MIVGLVLSVKLRMSDRSELAIQSFADDVFPVLLLFAVAATGLMLTVSAKSMAGYGFPFIGMAHAASVIALLLFAAAGYSLVYLLAGGGVFGAIVIFFIAKMLGQ